MHLFPTVTKINSGFLPSGIGGLWLVTFDRWMKWWLYLADEWTGGWGPDSTVEDSTAENLTYLRLYGPLVLYDDMIYNYTKSCNNHNQLILWSLLKLDTKILKEACGEPPEARKKKHVIKNRRILIVLSCHFSYFVLLYSWYSCTPIIYLFYL